METLQKDIAFDYSTFVPKVEYPYEIVNRSDDETLLVIDHGPNQKTHFMISEQIVHIIQLIDGQRSIDEIQKKLLEQDGLSISDEDLYNLIQLKLRKLTNKIDLKQLSKKNTKYLYLRITLLNAQVVKFLSQKMAVLFSNPKYVFTLFFINTFFLIAFISQNRMDFTGITTSFLVIPLTMGFSLIIHELGHASACRSYGAAPGEIGFGFYLFTPVLYTDVTNAWKLKRGERVVVDIAGMFMEGMLTTSLIVLYLITQNIVFYLSACTIGFNMFININPFLRYDGYWILSDLCNTPNLRAKSNENLKAIFSKEKRSDFQLKDYLLVFYALASLGIIVLFLLYTSIFYFKEIVSFPINFFTYIKDLLGYSAESGQVSFSNQILLPLLMPHWDLELDFEKLPVLSLCRLENLRNNP